MKLAIIGSGNLGSSLAKLLIRNGFKDKLMISDNDPNLDIMRSGIQSVSTQENIRQSDIIFIAVKPNHVSNIIDYINEYGHEDKVIVSAAAGVSLNNIEQKLNSEYYPIIRIMPNLPISLGHGSITFFPNKNVNATRILDLENVLRGPTMMQVKNEKLIDVSTMLTASTPAYISHMADEYIKFGVENGFTKEESIKLYSSTLIGTGHILLEQKSGSNIVDRVSTKNGVTRKGITCMENKNVNSILGESINASFDQLYSIKKMLD